MTEHETSVEKRLEAARKEIEGWRARRAKMGPMSAELWAEAIALAGELGVGRVSRELEMNHGALTRRVGPTLAVAKKSRRATARSEFVEVSKAVAAERGLSAVIELTSVSGNRMTVRLSEPVDVGALVAQFQAQQ